MAHHRHRSIHQHGLSPIHKMSSTDVPRIAQVSAELMKLDYYHEGKSVNGGILSKQRNHLGRKSQDQNRIFNQFPPSLLAFARLLPGNDICPDCSLRAAKLNNCLTWANVQFGTLICEDCAFDHIHKRKMSSSVISLTGRNSMSLTQILTILEGGNNKMLQALEPEAANRYDLQDALDAYEKRYFSKESDHYLIHLQQSVEKARRFLVESGEGKKSRFKLLNKSKRSGKSQPPGTSTKSSTYQPGSSAVGKQGGRLINGLFGNKIGQNLGKSNSNHVDSGPSDSMLRRMKDLPEPLAPRKQILSQSQNTLLFLDSFGKKKNTNTRSKKNSRHGDNIPSSDASVALFMSRINQHASSSSDSSQSKRHQHRSLRRISPQHLSPHREKYHANVYSPQVAVPEKNRNPRPGRRISPKELKPNGLNSGMAIYASSKKVQDAFPEKSHQHFVRRISPQELRPRNVNAFVDDHAPKNNVKVSKVSQYHQSGQRGSPQESKPASMIFHFNTNAPRNVVEGAVSNIGTQQPVRNVSLQDLELNSINSHVNFHVPQNKDQVSATLSTHQEIKHPNEKPFQRSEKFSHREFMERIENSTSKTNIQFQVQTTDQNVGNPSSHVKPFDMLASSAEVEESIPAVGHKRPNGILKNKIISSNMNYSKRSSIETVLPIPMGTATYYSDHKLEGAATVTKVEQNPAPTDTERVSSNTLQKKGDRVVSINSSTHVNRHKLDYVNKQPVERHSRNIKSSSLTNTTVNVPIAQYLDTTETYRYQSLNKGFHSDPIIAEKDNDNSQLKKRPSDTLLAYSYSEFDNGNLARSAGDKRAQSRQTEKVGNMYCDATTLTKVIDNLSPAKHPPIPSDPTKTPLDIANRKLLMTAIGSLKPSGHKYVDKSAASIANSSTGAIIFSSTNRYKEESPTLDGNKAVRSVTDKNYKYIEERYRKSTKELSRLSIGSMDTVKGGVTGSPSFLVAPDCIIIRDNDTAKIGPPPTLSNHDTLHQQAKQKRNTVGVTRRRAQPKSGFSKAMEPIYDL